MTERSRAATPSPWRRPGPSVMGPVDLPPPPAASAPESPPEAAPQERPRTGSRRRLIRWVAVIVGIILAVLACWQDPLYAL